MEARKITIVSTKTQRKSVIMSGAETLGELKRDLNEAGIDYEGMTFYEGTSKTELKTDESVLPKDVPYTNRSTGETINTNELVFMLTNTNKKIRSGAMARNRAGAYAFIKEHGLQKACVDMFGKNFTQCSTNDLSLLINKSLAKETSTPTAPAHNAGCVDVQARAAITELTNILYGECCIDDNQKDSVLNLLGSKAITPRVSESYKPDSASPYSDNEIDVMFRGIC